MNCVNDSCYQRDKEIQVSKGNRHTMITPSQSEHGRSCLVIAVVTLLLSKRIAVVTLLLGKRIAKPRKGGRGNDSPTLIRGNDSLIREVPSV